MMNIMIYTAIDPDSVGNVTHNLSLINLDGTYNYTINANFKFPSDSPLWFDFNTSLVPDGVYKMNVFAMSGDDNNDIQNRTTLGNFTIDNTLPTIFISPITPATAYTNSTLNCSAVYNDVGGDKGNVSIHWYNGTVEYSTATKLDIEAGQAVSQILAAGIQAKGETWNCSINATNAQDLQGMPNSTTRTISNSLPEITSAVTINVTTAYILTGQINCSFNHADADTEILTDHFRWYKNEIFTGNTTSWITNRSFAANDNLICEGWVSDTAPANSSLSNSTALAVSSLLATISIRLSF
jgi:hypothetical protein